jgi:cytochrome c6
MKKLLAVTVGVLSLGLLFTAGLAIESKNSNDGANGFKEFCASCHPDGGNIIDPKKTLYKKSLEANGYSKPADIILKMRNSGVKMPKFDTNKISDSKAKEIAEYILKTFSK